tara:strand:- start:391 stop:1371 length:981 start_codon:yes stop_codon:yes gene_type:complete
MGFKLPGKSMHSGTSSHTSALKMKKHSMAKMYKDSPADKALVGKQENLPEDLKAKIEASPAKATTPEIEERTSKNIEERKKKEKAYGGTKTWSEGQKDSGGTLNQITKDQRKYEKEMEAKDPSWNKREDNKWKKRQNKINKHLGSSKVYDTIPDRKTKDVDGETKMKGLGSNKSKTLTESQKQDEKTKISIEKDKIKNAKSDIKSSPRKSDEKLDAKDRRDKSQKEIGEIKSGRDNKKTGTVISRFIAKQKVKRNQRQLDRREKNRNKNEDSPAKYADKKVTKKSSSTAEKMKKRRDSRELKKKVTRGGKAYKKPSSLVDRPLPKK